MLTLREMMLDKDRRFPKALDVFASKYGLLGLFRHEHSSPILPEGKSFVAPEAVIERGRLSLVDPASEGVDLLNEALNQSTPRDWEPWPDDYQEIMAMPEEVRFAEKDAFRTDPEMGGHALRPTPYRSWEEVKEPYRALFVLDVQAPRLTSLLFRKESVFFWKTELKNLSPPPARNDSLDRKAGYARYLSGWLRDVSPTAIVGAGGQLEQSWRCSTLLEAVYLMLYLDLTGGSELRKCARQTCSNYFRLGSQGGSLYCSNKCTSLATTHRGRGQEP
jgi:hypothetical protein